MPGKAAILAFETRDPYVPLEPATVCGSAVSYSLSAQIEQILRKILLSQLLSKQVCQAKFTPHHPSKVSEYATPTFIRDATPLVPSFYTS